MAFRLVTGRVRRAASRALVSASSRYDYYVAKGIFEPYEPLDLSPFQGATLGRNVLDYVRFGSLELLKREIDERGVQGAVAEVGVGGGDFAMLLNHHFSGRRLYLFDTFSGFDSRDQDSDAQEDLPRCPYDASAVTPEHVRSRLPHPELADVRVGWFPETAEGLEDETFALAHIDVGLHRPTLAALEWFYPRLAVHGYLLLADYNTSHTPGVKRAVRSFASTIGAALVVLPDHSGTAVLAKV